MKTNSWGFARLVALAAVAVFASGCVNVNELPNPLRGRFGAGTPTPAVPLDLPVETQQQLRDFDLVTRALREQYIEPKSLNQKYLDTVSEQRARIARGLPEAQFFNALETVLDSVNDDDLVLQRPVATTNISATAPLAGTFSGIGVRIDLPREGRNRILVLNVYPDSPSELGGLKAHDAIIKIEGEPVTYNARNSVTTALRGPTGTSVNVTVQTPGQAPRDVTLTRKPISPIEATQARILPSTNLAYIKPGLTSAETMKDDVLAELKRLVGQQSLDGLILDLRTMNTSDFPLDDMLGIFANGQVGTRMIRGQRNREKIELTGKNIAGSQELPMIVLVSDHTQGPAESFAGILQDLGRARIFGTKTPGRVGVSAGVILPSTGGRVLLPIGEVRGTKDRAWYRVGITPDTPTELLWEQYSEADDPVLAEATRSLTNK